MQTPSFSLRPATEEDLLTVEAIEKRVHIAPWDVSHFREELNKPYSHFIVMTDDETDQVIAGYVVYWMMGHEEGSCEIINVAVDLPHRGMGFAKKLVSHVATQAARSGVKKVILDVRKSNIVAIQLYQSLRFVITHVRKTFYSNGEDAYCMTLLLDEVTQGLDF